jgi:hypothetical protein
MRHPEGMRRRVTLALIVAICFPAALLGAVRIGPPDVAELSSGSISGGWVGQRSVAETFLGFEIGEELRYVLGPDDALLRGERGLWSIRLEEIYRGGEDGLPEAVFALRHEWQGPQPIGDPPLRAIMRMTSHGTLRVNVHGFPVFIHHETIRHLAGLGDEAYTIDYELIDDNERYEKRTTMDGDRWYQTIEVRGHDTVDRDVPLGLFAFLPAGPGCLDRYVATYQLGGGVYPQPNSAAPPTPATATTVKVADNADCEESLFANPGLLNLAMPALWEAQGEREYVFFTPIGAVGKRQGGVAMGLPVGGGMPMGPPGRIPTVGSPNSMPNTSPRVSDLPLSSSTYHAIETLRFAERVSVRVGDRTRDAWLIELSDEAGPVYVDDDRVVLRLDLPPRAGGGERFLRRLWPSEF